MDAAAPKTLDSPALLKTAPIVLALFILALATAAVLGALAFEAAGYKPCELCLKERWPYYIGVPLAVLAVLFAWLGPRAAARAAFLLLGLIFLFSAGFGAYHAGVEWGFWAGPADCTGTLTKAKSNADFLQQLQTAKVVRCDAVAIRILGLSLAGWNAVVSMVLAAGALVGVRQSGQPHHV